MSIRNQRIVCLLLLVAVVVVLRCTGCGSSSGSSTSAPSGVAATDEIKETTFDDIKFEIEPDAPFEKSMLTPKVNELFDQRVRIRGYIFPTLKTKGIKQFILVRDNLECCFGPGAALHDCILVHMQEGKTAKFSTLPVTVQGKFSYEEFLDWDGTVRAIYRLDGKSVE